MLPYIIERGADGSKREKKYARNRNKEQETEPKVKRHGFEEKLETRLERIKPPGRNKICIIPGEKSYGHYCGKNRQNRTQRRKPAKRHDKETQ